jgi:hypothetical protein
MSLHHRFARYKDMGNDEIFLGLRPGSARYVIVREYSQTPGQGRDALDASLLL